MKIKENKVTRAVRSALIIGTAALAFNSSAFAAEDDASKKAEKLVITGSSIKRSDVEGELPVQVIDREDIDRSGVASVGELIQELPVMQGYTHATDSVGGGGGGVVSASIHDLGDTYTLVLLNGRRMAPRGDGNTIDLNSIPLAAIERIEVLTDGASATYGSDAIAGVVNFILKRDLQETHVNARYSSPQEEGGKSWNFNISSGFGDIHGDGYNFLFSYAHDRQEQLAAVDRDFAETGIISFRNEGRDLYFFNGSGNSIPGNTRVRWNDPVSGEEEEIIFNPYGVSQGAFGDVSCPEQTSAIVDECWFDYTSTIEIYPESTRDSFITQAEFQLSEDMTLFAELLYSDYEMTTRIAPFPTGWVRLTNSGIPGLVTDEVFPHLTQVQIDNLVSVDGRWRALPVGNRTTTWNTKATHIVVGLEGYIGTDIDYTATLTRSQNDTDQNYTKGWLLADEFISAVETGDINIFAPQGVVTSNDVQGLEYIGNWDNSKTWVDAANFVAQKPLFAMTGGEAIIATGFEFRSTSYEQTISNANLNEEVLFMSADTPYDLRRNTYGLFAEMALPFTETFDVSASIRYDNIGAIKSGQTDVNKSESDVTYKIGALWKATDSMSVRASLGTGFKAPDMLEIARPRSDFGVTSGNFACPFDATDPLEQYCLSGNSQYAVYLQGYSKLKPETSEQKTLGLVYSPTTDFSMTVDYWSVDMEDQVTSLSESQIFSNPKLYRDLFTTRMNNATGENELAIIQASVNVGKSENSGLDWKFEIDNELGIGELKTTFAGTYMIDSQYTLPGTDDEWVSSMGRFGDNQEVTFRNIAQITNELTHDKFTHTFTIFYRSGYQDQLQDAETCAVTYDDAFGDCVDVQLRVSAFVKSDWLTQYDLTDDIRVSFGINNILDRKPDLSLRSGGAGHQVGFDPRYADAFGRTYYLSGDYRF
ncbi:TonB-dependent receptor [Pleionea sediminis]|uniref:TonB-dependent receptor n=1 Tax=Pleionea sediminis TaxID=2569479 RepID=UPI00197B3AFE|nr:TonB-dependent receptor [Pleionea sediminis]